MTPFPFRPADPNNGTRRKAPRGSPFRSRRQNALSDPRFLQHDPHIRRAKLLLPDRLSSSSPEQAPACSFFCPPASKRRGASAQRPCLFIHFYMPASAVCRNAPASSADFMRRLQTDEDIITAPFPSSPGFCRLRPPPGGHRHSVPSLFVRRPPPERKTFRLPV